MAIYIMTGKSYLNNFIKDIGDKKTLHTQYAIISNTIRHTGKHKNIISANTLFPGNDMIIRYANTDDKEEFRYQYLNQLDDNLPLLSVIIKGVINKGYDIVFMCSKKEFKRWKYLLYLAAYIETEFKYPVIIYKDKQDLKGKHKADEEYALSKAKKILKKAKSNQKDIQLRSVPGRRKYIMSLDKKGLIKLMKEQGLYQNEKKKADMLEILELFFVNE